MIQLCLAVSLFLRNFLLPDEESIALIHDDDLLR